MARKARPGCASTRSRAALRHRGAAHRARKAQGRRRARAPVQRGRGRVPLPARRGGARGGAWSRTRRTCLIDASTAHRTDPTGSSGCPNSRPQREACARPNASRTPVATRRAFILLLRPLVDAGLVPPDTPRQRDLDHRLFGRRQENDRAVRGWAESMTLNSPRPYGLTLAHKPERSRDPRFAHCPLRSAKSRAHCPRCRCQASPGRR